MAKGFDVQGKTIEVLRNEPEGRFMAREIAIKIFEKYPDECRKKQERSTATVIPIDSDEALISQITAEVGATRKILQRKYPQLKVTDGRPKKYYYTESSEDEGIEQSENIPATSPAKGIREDALYSVLSKFLESEFEIYSKRIDEKSSSNRQKGANKWLHPDVVAVEDLSKNWDREIKECVQEYRDKKVRLWSFEVKVQVNRSNLREAFFQAVSNSSWANLGYLVVSEIDDNASNEIRILSSLHGIGLIVLDTDNPSEGRIAIPAKEKSDIDWNATNRLAAENRGFKEYVPYDSSIKLVN